MCVRVQARCLHNQLARARAVSSSECSAGRVSRIEDCASVACGAPAKCRAAQCELGGGATEARAHPPARVRASKRAARSSAAWTEGVHAGRRSAMLRERRPLLGVAPTRSRPRLARPPGCRRNTIKRCAPSSNCRHSTHASTIACSGVSTYHTLKAANRALSRDCVRPMRSVSGAAA